MPGSKQFLSRLNATESKVLVQLCSAGARWTAALKSLAEGDLGFPELQKRCQNILETDSNQPADTHTPSEVTDTHTPTPISQTPPAITEFRRMQEVPDTHTPTTSHDTSASESAPAAVSSVSAVAAYPAVTPQKQKQRSKENDYVNGDKVLVHYNYVSFVDAVVVNVPTNDDGIVVKILEGPRKGECYPIGDRFDESHVKPRSTPLSNVR